MDHRSGPKRASDYLYPPVEPFDQRMLDVGQGHSIYLEQCGNPQGVPVMVLHGGPGGGCSPAMRRYFDPAVYRVILFDQRGCGRSRPHAMVAANTTWDLVADIDLIRKTLELQPFILFGGSWGATLALVYAITHPDHIHHLVLRGVFLMTQSELDWFYRGGAGAFFPDLWEKFMAPIPEDERGDLIGAYCKRLFSGNVGEESRFGRVWANWENALASLTHEGPMGDGPSDYARAFSRLENHYFQNAGFLECDGWILRERHRITHIPASIVQGRLDMICPPISAWKLVEGWENADLRLISLAGHALSEPGISEALVQIMDGLR